MTSTPARAPSSWSDKFALGFAPMDRVHMDFLHAVDALLRADDAGMAAALEVVEAHTRQHFDEEERWMMETAFPARECHADEHAAVMRSVEGVRERVAGGDLDAARTLGAALLDWFPAHADYMDAALAHWMCKLLHGGTPIVLRRSAPNSQLPTED